MIKPNHQELSEIVGREIKTAAAAGEAGAILQKTYGIPVVVVSLGGLGAVLAAKDGVFHAIPPKVRPRNTIGAGDSLVAGIIYGMASGYDLVECLRLGVAAGTLAVIDLGTSLSKPRVERVTDFMYRVELKRLK